MALVIENARSIYRRDRINGGYSAGAAGAFHSGNQLDRLRNLRSFGASAISKHISQ